MDSKTRVFTVITCLDVIDVIAISFEDAEKLAKAHLINSYKTSSEKEFIQTKSKFNKEIVSITKSNNNLIINKPKQ